MQISIARKIDYWLGIPICFILSIFHKIQNIFTSRHLQEVMPKKILFLELSEMGSAILAYSAIKKVKEMYPEAELYFWIFRKNQDSVHILNIIPKQNVIVMRSGSFILLLTDTLKNFLRIRREGIEVVIDMELFSRFSSILTYLSGAKIRVGFHKFYLEGLYRGNLHTHKVSYNPYMHISKNFLALIYSLKAFTKEVPLIKISLMNHETTLPKIKSNDTKKEKIWQKLGEINDEIHKRNKLIILNAGISEILPLRRWPIENYTELTKRLLTDREIFIILVGIESQSFVGKINYPQKDSHIINLIGKTTIEELLALYNISTLLISHDSGIPNLASLTDINMIVLFGPETPHLYAPLTSNKIVLYKNFACSPCITAYNYRRSVCKNNRCLQAVTVEEVYTAAKSYLYNSEK